MSKIQIFFALCISLTGNLGLAEKVSPHIIWQDGPVHFNSAQIDQTSLRQDSEENTYFAVVKTSLWSELAKQIDRSGTLIASQNFGFANRASLVRIHSLDQLNQLALASHMESGLCGTIEVFPLNHQVFSLDDSKLSLPSFHSLAQFSDMNKLLDSVDLERIFADISSLESFGSRFHGSDSGLQAAQSIASWIEEIAESIPQLELELFQHSWTQQPSVIARIVGQESPDELVIIGAHLDSIAPNVNFAPGADDNASGVASLLEILRIIADHSLHFEKTIEIHAYAAEEIGLIGSRELASRYRNEDRRIVGMMQIDMNQWGSATEAGQVFLITNHTSEELRRRAQDWLKSYITDEYFVRPLPSSATSDHKAWFDQGFPTLFAFENPNRFNPNIHTIHDTSSSLNNPELARHITQLALSFLVYSAGLSDFSETYQEQVNQIFPAAGDHDLFLALDIAGDKVRMAISAPDNTSTVEYCEVISRWDSGCRRERRSLYDYLVRDERRLFAVADALSLTAELRLRVEAYDELGNRLSQRQIVISP